MKILADSVTGQRNYIGVEFLLSYVAVEPTLTYYSPERQTVYRGNEKKKITVIESNAHGVISTTAVTVIVFQLSKWRKISMEPTVVFNISY